MERQYEQTEGIDTQASICNLNGVSSIGGAGSGPSLKFLKKKCANPQKDPPFAKDSAVF